MLDQEQRLIELHSLLVALPAVEAPGALRPGQASLGLELVTIPRIDGTTGGKRQITASDRTRVFPRPRLALGLPVGPALRAFVGLAYIPPLELRGVSSHLGALEAGLAWVPGALACALRLQAVHATSRSPVTQPDTRDTLRSTVLGADLSVGYSAELGPLGTWNPYAGLGLARIDGRFRVESDGAVLTSVTTRPSVALGLRLAGHDLEAVSELVSYPGRLRQVNLRLGWVPRLGSAQ
jgi:hypothetical protein